MYIVCLFRSSQSAVPGDGLGFPEPASRIGSFNARPIGVGPCSDHSCLAVQTLPVSATDTYSNIPPHVPDFSRSDSSWNVHVSKS